MTDRPNPEAVAREIHPLVCDGCEPSGWCEEVHVKRLAPIIRRALAKERTQTEAKYAALVEAAREVIAWGPFPKIKADDGNYYTYGYMLGSNGERDFMRGRLEAALRALEADRD